MVDTYLKSSHLCLIIEPSNVASYSYVHICDRDGILGEIIDNFEGYQESTLSNNKANSTEFKFT